MEQLKQKKKKEKQVLNKNSDIAQQDVEWGTVMYFFSNSYDFYKKIEAICRMATFTAV